MNKLFTLLLLTLILFTLNSRAEKNPVLFTADSSQEGSFTNEDANDAIDNFNKYLLDPQRKLYFRDTDQPDKLGAIWTQAIYWDMIMNAYKRTNDAKYSGLMEEIYQGGYDEYDHYNWDNKDVWFIYDDIMWWVISLARAYEMTGDQKYLDLSESGFKRVWSGSGVVGDVGSYDPVDGGMFWMFQYPDKPDAGKMSCINYPTVVAAMTLYQATGNEDYLNKAKEIYDWSRRNIFDLSSGRVADSKHGSGTPNWKAHTYNQATCIGAAVLLYNETKEQQFLDDAVLAANYTKNVMSDSNGILPHERGEEQGVYTAIFAQYIIRLIEDGGKTEYIPWLRLNINTGWKNRDISRGLTYGNYNISYPESTTISCYNASGIPALMQICPSGGDFDPIPAPTQTEITDEAGLKAIANNLDGNYILMNDIVLTEDWIPIGNDNNPFTGIFDGNGKIIKNLKYNKADADRVGLFGLAEVAIIKRVGLENVSIIGRNDVGALAGRVRGAIIDQCYVTGYVEGNDHVGSIVGGAESGSGQSTLMDCYAYASVVTRSTQVGGILGTTKDLTLKNSYFSGSVVSPGSNSGGILSLIDGGSSNIVENVVCLAHHIKGGTAYRILANDGGRVNVTRLMNNYGFDQSLVNGNPVSSTSSNLGANLKHGANKTLAELKDHSFYESLQWDMSNKWKIEEAGFPVFTYQSLPLDVDRIVDFPQLLVIPEGDIYQLNSASLIPGKKVTYKISDTSKVTIDENGLLSAVAGGDVTITATTEADAFSKGTESVCIIQVKTVKSLIATPEDLDNIRYRLDGTFTLANDIDLSGYDNFDPIGTNADQPFTGKLNGQGFRINNLKIDRTDGNRQGLFGYLKNAEIKDLGLADVSIVGKNDVGGLAGVALGAVVEQVYVTGYIEGNDHVGGLFGATAADANVGHTKISNAYINAHVVTRSSQVGGILGVAKSTDIKNVYVAGKIESGNLNSQGANAAGIVSLNEDKQVSVEAVAIIPEYIKGGTPNYFVCRDNDFLSASLVYARNDMPSFTYATADHGKEGYLVGNNLLDPQTFLTQSFYQNTLGWDFETIWQMPAEGYPVFKSTSTGIDVLPQVVHVHAYSSYGSVIISSEVKAKISVFDAMGRMVYSMELEGTSNPVKLNPGIYLISSEYKGVKNTIKLLHRLSK